MSINFYSAYREQSYFSSLDGIRFFSILAVIWHHSFPDGVSDALKKGFLGVDMFFVLSGYLIVTLLLREKDKGSISLKKFYIRRALRIFPLYFGVIFAIATAIFLFKSDDPEGVHWLSQIPVYLFFLANFSLTHIPTMGIYWSLATEEQFYIFWPFLEKLLSNKTLYLVLGLILIFNQIINFGLFDNWIASVFGSEAVSLHILDTTFTPICLGVLIAHMLHKPDIFNLMYRLFGAFVTPLVSFIILILSILLSGDEISGLPRLIIQLLMGVWLISLVVRENHILTGFMSFYLIRRLGQISYGMYIFHLIALHVVLATLEKLQINPEYVKFFACFVLSAILAELSFRFFESPILSLRKKFTPSRAPLENTANLAR